MAQRERQTGRIRHVPAGGGDAGTVGEADGATLVGEDPRNGDDRLLRIELVPGS